MSFDLYNTDGDVLTTYIPDNTQFKLAAYTAMKRAGKYSQLDNMTKRPKTALKENQCLSTFNHTMRFVGISEVTFKGRQSNQPRHDCLIRMAYFMTLSACTQICSLLDANLQFSFDDPLKTTTEYTTAISTMYLLADLLTVPIYSTQHKLKNVEQTALEACAVLCKKKQQSVNLA